MRREASEPGALTTAYRTVTPGFGGRSDTEMNVLGWSLFLGLMILLVPLLPFLVVGWAVSKAVEFVDPQRGE